MAPHHPVDVTGGTGGITAQCDEITGMARRLGELADELLWAAFTLHGYLIRPGLVESAALDPVGWASFEADLADALDGPLGLSWVATACAGVDVTLEVAAEAYRSAEAAVLALHDPVLGGLQLIPALDSGARVLAATGDPIAAAQRVVARDPEIADTVIDALGIPVALVALGTVWPDGHGVARPLGRDTADTTAPRRLRDLLGGLARRSADAHHGSVDVRVLTMPDGSRRAIVDITGTKSWTPGPTGDVTSLSTNGRAMSGATTAYEQGVLAALRTAGVRRGDPVMLIGHSQGGMVAVNAARHAGRTGEFTITHVITAGSPIGVIARSVPAQVQVLALENRRDVVPHLDGAANPDAPNITTARASHGNGSVLDDHDVAHSYVPLSVDVEATRTRSVRDFLTGARGYFGATSMQTHTFQIVRRY